MTDHFRDLAKISREVSQSHSIYSGIAAELQRPSSVFASVQDALNARLAFDRSLFHDTSSILAQAQQAALTVNVRELTQANRSLTELVSQATITDSAISRIFAEHSALRASLELMGKPVRDLLSSIDATRLLHTSLSSQMRLSQLEASSIGKLVGASSILTADLTKTFDSFTRSYREVIESIPHLPEFGTPLVAKYSPVEYSLQMEVLERISVEGEDIDVEALPSVDEELASFDSQLLVLINGARHSLESDNPDRARHVTTSVRELFTHILHGLSPDDQVRKWSTDPAHYHNGRPTRRTVALYLSRVHF